MRTPRTLGEWKRPLFQGAARGILSARPRATTALRLSTCRLRQDLARPSRVHHDIRILHEMVLKSACRNRIEFARINPVVDVLGFSFAGVLGWRQQRHHDVACRSQVRLDDTAERCTVPRIRHGNGVFTRRLGPGGRVPLSLVMKERRAFLEVTTRPSVAFGLGTLLGTALVWNRLANLVTVEGARARADILGAIASSALLLYAVSAWQVDVRSTAPIRVRDGRYLERTTTCTLEDQTTSALVWLTDTMFAGCPYITTAVWLEPERGRVVAQRGVVKTELGMLIDLKRLSERGLIDSGEPDSARYYADLKALPAKVELERLLPADTQAVWIGTFHLQPHEAGDPEVSSLILVLGCNKIRPFLDKDLGVLGFLQHQRLPFV